MWQSPVHCKVEQSTKFEMVINLKNGEGQRHHPSVTARPRRRPLSNPRALQLLTPRRVRPPGA